MTRVFRLVVTLAYCATYSVAFCAGGGSTLSLFREPPLSTYANNEVGFSYTPPTGMLRDDTDRSKSEIEKRSKLSAISRRLTVLLAISSQLDSDSPDWRSITIETYPRKALSEPDDVKAAAQMNAWVAHSKEASALPKAPTISGQTFTVSVFGLQEGRVKKGAVVFTTVRKGKLLSFAFAANSPEKLKELTETMNSVKFF